MADKKLIERNEKMIEDAVVEIDKTIMKNTKKFWDYFLKLKEEYKKKMEHYIELSINLDKDIKNESIDDKKDGSKNKLSDYDFLQSKFSLKPITQILGHDIDDVEGYQELSQHFESAKSFKYFVVIKIIVKIGKSSGNKMSAVGAITEMMPKPQKIKKGKKQ